MTTENQKKPERESAEGKEAAVEATSVNLGHLFALRPKVNTSFPQAEFAKAKRDLEDERYESIEDAARAVAAKALESSNQKPAKSSHGRRR